MTLNPIRFLLLVVVCLLSSSNGIAEPITNIAQVSTGGFHSLRTPHACVLSTQGGVFCWGGNDFGQVGNGNTIDQIRPIAVTGLASGATQVVSGGAHSCAITATGGVKCWGSNQYGQLGDGSTTNRNTPVDVSTLTSGVLKLSAGRYHTCAIVADGAVKCWGSDSNLQLGGEGSFACGGEFCSKTPIEVFASNISNISAGGHHTCAVTTSGGVKCWGDNTYGQLGNNSTSAGVSDVRYLSSGVLEVATGEGSSCALLSTGSVMCWGVNLLLQLGHVSQSSCQDLPCSKVPDFVNDDSGYPFYGATAISGGDSFYCVLTGVGSVKCWGEGLHGQLGIHDGWKGTDTCIASVNSCSDTPLDVPGVTESISYITCGGDQACAVTTEGTVKCWGAGSYTPYLISEPYKYFSLAVNVTLNSAPFSGVFVDGGALGNTTTGSSGNYQFQNVREDTSYTVTPAKSGYCFMPSSISSTGIVADRTINFSGFVCYTISGIVTGQGSGISGVVIDAGEIGTQTTDNSGNYSFERVAAGTNYVLTPSKAGFTFSPNSQIGTVNRDISANFAATHTVSGYVKTSSSSPLSGVTVTGGVLGDQITDSNGFYQFNNVAHRTSYIFNAAKAGYTFSPVNSYNTVNSNLSLNFAANQIVYSISGYLRTDGSGPIRNYTVDGGPLGTTTTDTNGYYFFSNVPSGTSYTITPRLAWYMFNPASQSGILNSNASASFTGTRVYYLSGTIKHGDTPLQGVTVNGGPLGVRITNESGTYSFGSLSYGTSYSITPVLAGYQFSPSSHIAIIFNNEIGDFSAFIPTPTPTSSPTATHTPTTTPTAMPTQVVPIKTPTAVSTNIPTSLQPTIAPSPAPIRPKNCVALEQIISPVNAGTITVKPKPNCSGSYYKKKTKITVKATPAKKRKFKNWSGAVTGTSKSASFKIVRDSRAKATFK